MVNDESAMKVQAQAKLEHQMHMAMCNETGHRKMAEQYRKVAADTTLSDFDRARFSAMAKEEDTRALKYAAEREELAESLHVLEKA